MQQPEYGIDAPGVIRNLTLAGFGLLVVSVGSLVGLLPKGLAIEPMSGLTVRLPLTSATIVNTPGRFQRADAATSA